MTSWFDPLRAGTARFPVGTSGTEPVV